MFKFLVIFCLMSLVYTQDDDTTVEPDTTENNEDVTTEAPTTKKPDPEPTSRPTTCPPYDNGVPTYLPDEIYCGKFYECSGGTPYELDCAPGTYFSIENSECEFGVDCGDRLLSTTTTMESTTEE